MHTVALSESEVHFRELAEVLPVGVFEQDGDGTVVYLNCAGRHILGVDSPGQTRDVLRRHLDEADRRRAARHWRQLLSGQSLDGVEYRFTTPSGEKKVLVVSSAPVREGDRVVGARGSIMDVTDRRLHEQAMLDASRMEATATLAGGIAHDLNNLLVAVLGNAQLMQMKLPEGSAEMSKARAIAEAARRAGVLVNQLLAFAREGKYRSGPVDLNEVAERLVRNPPAPLGRCRIRHDAETALRPVEADRSQMLLALGNLAVNAAEAVTGDELVVIRTRNLDVPDGGHPEHPELAPGPYVVLDVIDRGAGMDERVRQRAFEPFFTTRFHGRGLGLAAVFGIVANHGGVVRLNSMPGKGTTATIVLPACREEGFRKADA